MWAQTAPSLAASSSDPPALHRHMVNLVVCFDVNGTFVTQSSLAVIGLGIIIAKCELQVGCELNVIMGIWGNKRCGKKTMNQINRG